MESNFVKELAKFVSEEGYWFDGDHDMLECTVCGEDSGRADKAIPSRSDINHKPDCIVGRAEQYLKDNP